jgi:hypothetical protein
MPATVNLPSYWNNDMFDQLLNRQKDDPLYRSWMIEEVDNNSPSQLLFEMLKKHMQQKNSNGIRNGF